MNDPLEKQVLLMLENISGLFIPIDLLNVTSVMIHLEIWLRSMHMLMWLIGKWLKILMITNKKTIAIVELSSEHVSFDIQNL